MKPRSESQLRLEAAQSALPSPQAPTWNERDYLRNLAGALHKRLVVKPRSESQLRLEAAKALCQARKLHVEWKEIICETWRGALHKLHKAGFMANVTIIKAATRY